MGFKSGADDHGSDVYVKNNKKLYFGDDDAHHIEYNSAQSMLVISGTADVAGGGPDGGIVVSGSQISVDCDFGLAMLTTTKGAGSDGSIYFGAGGNGERIKSTAADTLHIQAGTDNPGHILLKTTDGAAAGGGFDGAAGVTIYIAKVNGEIVTTILVDIEGLLVSGTVKDIIGEDGVGAAYVTRISTVKTGIVYKAEMSCIEAPAGSNTTADIDLVSNTASLAEDVEYDDSGTAVAILPATAGWTVGMTRTSAAGLDLSNCEDDYLYLVNGSGANSGGTYTAGKFIIKLYGASF